jgi:hypothetical protein
MSKELKIKSNGLRNELKEIRKSIDKLTNAMIEIHLAQTNTHYENNAKLCTCSNDDELHESKKSRRTATKENK